jgi:hypothetical protein
MSQIASIGNLTIDQFKELLALGPARQIVEKRFGLFSKKRIENPTLQQLTSLLTTCTECSGSVFVHISETVGSLADTRRCPDSKLLSDNTGSWVEVYRPAEIPQILDDLAKFTPESEDDQERSLIASGVAWFTAQARKCTPNQVCVFCVS